MDCGGILGTRGSLVISKAMRMSPVFLSGSSCSCLCRQRLTHEKETRIERHTTPQPRFTDRMPLAKCLWMDNDKNRTSPWIYHEVMDIQNISMERSEAQFKTENGSEPARSVRGFNRTLEAKIDDSLSFSTTTSTTHRATVTGQSRTELESSDNRCLALPRWTVWPWQWSQKRVKHRSEASEKLRSRHRPSEVPCVASLLVVVMPFVTFVAMPFVTSSEHCS